ncbi:MAG: ATP-binding protein [Chitinophagaceae bacterium]|nr:ATP-binding protein [Chitinophagaceae bacterium]
METYNNSVKATDFLSYAINRAKENLGIDYIIDNSNKQIIEMLCMYFTNNPEFEKMGKGFSLMKGLMVAGGIGTGKTTLMRLFAVNPKFPFKVVSCRKIVDDYLDKEVQALSYYSQPFRSSTYYSSLLKSADTGFCYDDLGTERTAVHFGDRVNVMAEIIQNCYEQYNTPKYFTHITTNLTGNEIEQMYGSRVRSRMREQYNLITLGGNDRRK